MPVIICILWMLSDIAFCYSPVSTSHCTHEYENPIWEVSVSQEILKYAVKIYR